MFAELLGGALDLRRPEDVEFWRFTSLIFNRVLPLLRTYRPSYNYPLSVLLGKLMGAYKIWRIKRGSTGPSRVVSGIGDFLLYAIPRVYRGTNVRVRGPGGSESSKGITGALFGGV